jgi:hypothetical protein
LEDVDLLSRIHLAVNIREGTISSKKAMGRPRLHYLKQIARNTAADSNTAMKRMACNNFRWKAANQSKGWRIRRRHDDPERVTGTKDRTRWANSIACLCPSFKSFRLLFLRTSETYCFCYMSL